MRPASSRSPDPCRRARLAALAYQPKPDSTAIAVSRRPIRGWHASDLAHRAAKAEFGRNHIEAWEAYQDFLITGQAAAQGALEKPQDLKGFITNERIADCNNDKERIRKIAREWK